MIIKKLQPPLKLLTLEALSRRLPQEFPKREAVDDELARTLAGYRGEKSLQYYWSFLPENDCFIFHDLRLPHRHHHFQIDILLMFPSFFLIIEAKNFSGTLYFENTFRQMIRTTDEKKEIFSDPILQVKRQQYQLQQWLRNQGFPSMPIETRVVITNSSTYISASPEYSECFQTVTRSGELPFIFQDLTQKYQKRTLSTDQCKRISQVLLQQHRPYVFKALEHFYIGKNDILKGVQCPKCSFSPMKRRHGTWKCPACSTTSKNAHTTAFHDYSLLLKPSITNREARDFLQIDSRFIIKNLLNSMKLFPEGTRRGRKYHFPLHQQI